MTGTNITRLGAAGSGLTAPQLDLIKRTVAKDANATEFDHFMHTAGRLGLDPLRKQIICVIFNKDKPDKRNMTIIVTVDGLRVIAARQGDYGPARDEPEIEYDPDLRSDLNPHGIVRAKVVLWKRYSDGWQPVAGVAHWDEFAPVEEEWDYNPELNRRAPTGKKKLAENWKRMGRVMIAKCASAQALRAGWPDDFSGLYVEEEMQRAFVLDSASEMLEHHAEQERLARVGRRGEMLAFIFDPRAPLEMVARDKVAERLERFADGAQHPAEIAEFRRQNADSLNTFWAWERADALLIKRRFEAREEELAIKLGLEDND